ncbi:VOC family protein [Chthonobacter rhizosphaerae]|uniref:VOC family protein n=1 Tax=Chthonobacter rhizosphaerae TaxID=2735553 RepID=UPI0015EF5F60|nr:VOC family protein [Chthonobacter rhizosphaerae]
MHGTVYWTELMTADVETAKAFYADIMGWTYSTMPMPDGDYTLIHRDGMDAPAGGMKPWAGAEGSPTNIWFTYFAVDNVDAALAKAADAGGTVVRPPFEVPGVGRIAIVMDATGAVSGWVTPAPRG